MLEEYVPEIKYIKGTDNDTAEDLDRLLLINSDVTDCNITWEQLAESYGVDQLDGNTFPLTHQTINKYQRKYKELVPKILLGHSITVYTDHKNLTFENFTTERVLHWRLMLE